MTTLPKTQRDLQVSISHILICYIEAESSVRDAVEWVKRNQNNVLTVLDGAQLQALSKE